LNGALLAVDPLEPFSMREEIGNLVHKIIHAGLDLKERLAGGEQPDLEKEQAKLKALLSDAEGRRYHEYSGETAPDNSLVGGRSSGGGGRSSSDHFLGIRYALVCWLDEIFSLDAPPDWASRWSEETLELNLFGMRDRALNFWHQARKAETRPNDALEAFFLCVMLGFRGDYRDQPDRLQSFVSSAYALISKGQGQEWSAGEELPATTYVPPLWGRDKLQKMVLICGGVLLLLILLGSFVVVYRLGK
jgi:type VI secretion system protein ImpK